MLYLLKSLAYGENDNPIEVLKIGYTNNMEIRMSNYKSSNPTIKILYVIENGTHNAELLIHAALETYRFMLNEWYKYDDYIIQGFSTSKTQEDLLNYFGLSEKLHEMDMVQLRERMKREIQDNIIVINNIMSPNRFLSCYKIYESISSDIKYDSDLYELISNKYGIDYKLFEEGIKEYAKLLSSLSESLIKLLDTFNSLTNFKDKMRLLCDLAENVPEDFCKCKVCYPSVYVNYISIVGIDKIRALCFEEAAIQREMNSLLTIDSEKEGIIGLFEIGKTYSKVEIKNKLKEYYESKGITKKPKASDLEDYFETSDAKITNKETGKRDHGFKIIKKK